jgi:SAM-dependent methyltransferase
VFIDLVNSPPSNSYLTKEQLNEPEVFYPLKLFVCENCFLVQIDEIKKASEIFSHDYAYFSSYSTSWLEHAHRYVDMITERFGYDEQSQVMELASNDGYLLQYFQKQNISALGIEPSKNVAHAAQEKGIETIIDFFGVKLAKHLVAQNRKADLIIGNNVFAHVPDVNDFVAGMKIALNDGGVITLEFPHLMQLIEQNQFDTIYHEHYSYFSFYTASLIFDEHGLELFDVEQISTHGGSLRIYGKHKEDTSKSISSNVADLLKEEAKAMQNIEYYKGFQEKVNEVKINLVSFLLVQKKLDKKVVAYGAAAKGNTLLNYCGVKNDLIEFVVDASPHKQGKYLPGSHIPIVTEEMIKKNKSDYILILPWNLITEITDQLKYIKEWDAKLVLPIPKLEII